MDLGAAAQRELRESPLAQSRIDAFAHAAPFVYCFAVRALHAPAPGGDAATVVAARRIGVALVLAPRGRAIHLDARAGCPFDIVILVEAAIDEVTHGSVAVALFEPIKHRAQQAAVGAGGRHIDADHDLTFGDGAELAIVGRPIAAIGHLHDARLWVGGRDAGLLLFGSLFFIGLGAPNPLGFDLRKLIERRGHARRAHVGSPLTGRPDAPVACVRVVVWRRL